MLRSPQRVTFGEESYRVETATATGETRWRSREPGDGFPTLVGDQLVIITKPGTLHVADASPEGYNERARVELFDDHAWSEVAYADGRLFARSMAETTPMSSRGTRADSHAITGSRSRSARCSMGFPRGTSDPETSCGPATGGRGGLLGGAVLSRTTEKGAT